MPAGMIELDEAAFKAWIAAYPRKLERDVAAFCEPPFVTWNDFERAPFWPDSIVASTSAGTGQYSVLADLNAPVVSDSAPDMKPLFDRDGVELRVGDEVEVWWGTRYNLDGNCAEYVRRHTVTRINVGSIYECWGISGCGNHARSMDLRLVRRALKEPS